MYKYEEKQNFKNWMIFPTNKITCCSFHFRITSGSSFFSLGFFILLVDILVVALFSPLVDNSELSVDKGSSGGLGDTRNMKCSFRNS